MHTRKINTLSFSIVKNKFLYKWWWMNEMRLHLQVKQFGHAVQGVIRKLLVRQQILIEVEVLKIRQDTEIVRLYFSNPIGW